MHLSRVDESVRKLYVRFFGIVRTYVDYRLLVY